MKVKLLFSMLLTAAWLFSSCDNKDDCNNRNGDYSTGVFVVNEGPFGGNGTITWHNPATGETVQNLYETENCGASLGQFVQSITFHNGKGYIVVNGANKVVVVNARTFQYIDVIEGLELPRFLIPIDDQFAYVSQWGADGVSGSLAKVNLISNLVVKTIPVGSGPEKMLRQGNTLFVVNSGGYGVDSTVVAFDITQDLVQDKHIASGKNPASLVLEDPLVANPVYLCKGYYLDPVPDGNLNRLLNGSPAGTTVPAYADDLVIDDSGMMFFTANTEIFQVSGSGGQYNASPVFAQNAYGLALDAATDLLYCGDAKDFSAAGEVVVRRFDGTVVNSFPAGIGPGEIVIVR